MTPNFPILTLQIAVCIYCTWIFIAHLILNHHLKIRLRSIISSTNVVILIVIILIHYRLALV